MSALFRTTRHLPRPYRPLPIRSATFSTSPRSFLKEDADRSPEEVDAKKHEQIQKQKEGKGHWHEELASAGEASIAADKDAHKVEDHDSHMEDLQKQTAGKAEKEHPEGKA